MTEKKLTVVILAYNEEGNIAGAIQSAKGLDADILVIDSNSTDNTREIAKSLGARVAVHPFGEDFAFQRNLAKEYASTPWIFHLDADERITEKLAASIKKAVEGEFFLYEAKRVTTSLGGAHRFGSLSPDYVGRLMPKDATWVGKVHEHPECSRETRRLSGELTHEPYANWAAWERKVEKYTTIWANDAYNRGKRAGGFSPFLRAAFGFLKMFVVKVGFLDGAKGLNAALAHAFYTFMKYVKLSEKA